MTYWLARAGGQKPEGPFSRADLSRMYHAGDVDALDQVCLSGTEAWQDLGKLLELRDYPPAAAGPVHDPPKLARKKRKVLGNAGCVVFVLGLLALLLFWPLGLLLIVVALIVEQCSVKMICSNCGNVTVQTARECAVCRSHFKN